VRLKAVPSALRDDYAQCARLLAERQENFTVASRLLPAALRPHMAAIYAYCRGVDDLGDEYRGDRRAALDAWAEELERCYTGRPRTAGFRALQHTVRRFDLPRAPLEALITANRMDQEGRRFTTFADLRAYCACSADPVGRMVLWLFGLRDEARARLSDDTCTALQLTNFWQDLGPDLARGRLYIPLEDLERFGCRIDHPESARADGSLRAVLAFEVARTHVLFRSGARLEAQVPPRLAVQLRLYRLGGEAVLGALRRQGLDPLLRRPRLGASDRVVVAARALLPLALPPAAGDGRA
jgi:squalene synthase HpnC